MIQMAIFWWALHYNHRPAESFLLPRLGYGNSMTLTRGLFTCLLAGFLFAPQPLGMLAWAPAVLYTLERLVDYFDGYVARITGQETKLGAILDMEFDGLGLLIAIALGIQYGKLPVWYLVLGMARQLFVAGMWLRRRWNLPVYELPPSDQRRIIAGYQTGFASVVLWPVLSPQITQLACLLFAVPLVFSFGRDWLVVSAVVDPDSASYRWARQAVKWFFVQWAPLAARLAAALIALWLLWRAAPGFEAWASTLADAGWNPGLLPPMVIVWGVAALLLVLGVFGRAAALLLFLLACLDILTVGLRWADNGLLLVCVVVVAHLGSGRFALWQPDERLVRVKLGVPPTPAS
jgi:CDP-diacylglycerol--glycerol-3-phosphate 3-phosphatidyltransferase